MSEHTCRHGWVVRIHKTKCVLCMRAERDELLVACKLLVTALERSVDNDDWANQVNSAMDLAEVTVAKIER